MLAFVRSRRIGLRIVYEDPFALLVDKPAGLAVHPTLNYPEGTLANGYAAWALEHGVCPVFRPVNRIDKDTSGLVLAAKHAYAAPLLAQRVQKLYYAVPQGELPLGPGVIDAPIGRRGDSIIGRCVTPEGKPSRTEYEILRAENGLSLAACLPVTGRTHQIRCPLCPSGTPAGRGSDSTAAAGSESGGRRCIVPGRPFGCPRAVRKGSAFGSMPRSSCTALRWSVRCRRTSRLCFGEKSVQNLCQRLFHPAERV